MTAEHIDMLVSAGHDEYSLDLPPGEWEVVWSASSPVVEAWMDGEEMLDFDRDYDAFEAKWVEVTGRTVEEMRALDANLTWETIYRLRATPGRLKAALTRLVRDIAAEPGGDDDTFDYWPSGVRLALDVAPAVGGGWHEVVTAIARDVIVNDRADVADELLAKCGIHDDGTETP